MMDFKAVEFKADEVDKETGIFKGYAATWDLDSGNDVIVKGAFAKSLAEKRNQVKILWQHDAHKPIGAPIEMREDERGLYIEGKISDTSLGKDAQILMKDGVIDRMSIGYIANGEKTTVKDGVRYLEEIELFEFSLVTWPMNDAAVITGVKELKSKEIERVLREAGLTKSQASCVANNGLNGLREADNNESKETEQLLKELKSSIIQLQITASLKN
jgi:HK97 family phage prohead protease